MGERGWANQGSDLFLSGDLVTILRNNSLESRAGATPAEDTVNISVTPVYENNGPLIYVPIAGSPLLDAGTRPPFFVPIPAPFDDNWAVCTLDLLSRNRVQGAMIGIGAFESTRVLLFADGFE